MAIIRNSFPIILGVTVVSADQDDLQEARKKHLLSTIYMPIRQVLRETTVYKFNEDDLLDTDRQVVVQSRVGQDRFRT